jgi:sulfhydrogenase subunit beta (sulfur reductase)
MKNNQLNKFLKALCKEFLVYAPVKQGREIYVKQITDPREIDWSGKTPFNPWKKIFLSVNEVLFNYDEKEKPIRPVVVPEKIAALGMNILDLKALVLYDQVFEKDIYYQDRRQNILVVGYFSGAPKDYRQYKIFSTKFEEKDLEHLIFDVFIEKIKGNNFKFFSGSRMGQKILEKYGLKNYEHIEFAGPVSEEGMSSELLDLKPRVEKSKNKKIWQKLGQLCLACGKCAITCPTCFCFNDLSQINEVGRQKIRKWTTCFYYDFSRIAGREEEGIHFLKTMADKIYFWYEHKFVRIPKEFSLPGCVKCGRCTRVCPVGVDIKEVLKKLLTE